MRVEKSKKLTSKKETGLKVEELPEFTVTVNIREVYRRVKQWQGKTERVDVNLTIDDISKELVFYLRRSEKEKQPYVV